MNVWLAIIFALMAIALMAKALIIIALMAKALIIIALMAIALMIFALMTNALIILALMANALIIFAPLGVNLFFMCIVKWLNYIKYLCLTNFHFTTLIKNAYLTYMYQNKALVSAVLVYLV